MSVTVPDPTLDFTGLYSDQTEDVILARWIPWANEGLDPVQDAGLWVDTREGGHWRTTTMPGIREFARLYDLAGTEVPMAAFVLWAWGEYLDDLAAAVNVERLPAVAASGNLTWNGPVGTQLDAGTTVSTVPQTPDDPAPTFFIPAALTIPAGGAITVPIQASEPGAAGDVAAGAIIAQSTPLPAGVTFTNAQATIGGEDPETDEALRVRVLQAMAGKGPGNAADYVRWASAWPGVGSVHVVPTWNGPNTVLVGIADANGQPVPAATVTALQNDLDPVSGKGSGTAPVGAQATVVTPSLLSIAVAATVTYETGYSATGTGNTVALHDQIFAAIQKYLLTIAPGGTVVLSHVAGIIATTLGVHDVTGVTLNGVAANAAVGLSPAQVPNLTTVTI